MTTMTKTIETEKTEATVTIKEKQGDLMEHLAERALDRALEELDEIDEQEGVGVLGSEPTTRGRSTVDAAKLVTFKPLGANRVGCIVWWSAADIAADPVKLHRALLDAQHHAECPKCGSGAGHRCVDEVGAETDVPCSERSPDLASLVGDPVGPGTAMRRAVSRSQGGLGGKLRWYDCGVDDAGKLHIALAEQRPGLKPGDVLAAARWSLAVDVETGALDLPPTVVLLGDERRALRSLLERFKKERAFLTAQDVGDALVKLFLERLGGIRVKRGGAIYFVPAPGDGALDHVQSAFSVAGVGLHRLEVDKESGAQLAGSASESLEDEAASLLAKVNDAVKRLEVSKDDESGKGGPQIKTMLARLDDVDRLRKQARGYRAMLGALTDHVEKALSEAEKASRGVLDYLTGGIVAGQ